MARYGSKASDKVEKAMHERKAGTLKSGLSSSTIGSACSRSNSAGFGSHGVDAPVEIHFVVGAGRD
jgi:hypothetical protein